MKYGETGEGRSSELEKGRSSVSFPGWLAGTGILEHWCPLARCCGYQESSHWVLLGSTCLA